MFFKERKGVSVDDAMVQNDLASNTVANEFHRLSRATTQNFTQVILDNSRATSTVFSEG
ncbi:hypothetical protein BX616_009801 [Lobosporangium transversale]|nr:hypothetical protein BX616_009801 [Lobosporangium transversale]